MELTQVEKLLDAYFEGQTSEQEEQWLQDYFLNEPLPKHMEIYRSMFVYFADARKETSKNKVVLPVEKPSGTNNWYRIAAVVIALVGITYFVQKSIPGKQQKEETLQAYWQTKEALHFISTKLNQSAEHLSYLEEFPQSAGKIFKAE